MHTISETHDHEVSTRNDRQGFYCPFVYLDGSQCSTFWLFRPQFPGQATRILNPEKVRDWQKRGGPIDE
jgi:hypothetical protein